MGILLANVNSRSLAARLIGIGVLITFMLALHTYSSLPTFSFRLPDMFSPRKRSSCPPNAWNKGQWHYKPHSNLTTMTKAQDVFELSGLEGCASDREYFWHLGVDHEEEWNRFPNVSSYAWKPSDGCDVRPLNGMAMVKDMVEQGGWLLLGGMSRLLY